MALFVSKIGVLNIDLQKKKNHFRVFFRWNASSQSSCSWPQNRFRNQEPSPTQSASVTSVNCQLVSAMATTPN
jgi:hypothetical protein